MTDRTHRHGAIVALVGRPNVGKSTIFNRLVGRKTAIVHDEPGVTRDRHYGDVTSRDRRYTLIDTGGFDPESEDPMKLGIKRQIDLAISEADVVICVLEGGLDCRARRSRRDRAPAAGRQARHLHRQQGRLAPPPERGLGPLSPRHRSPDRRQRAPRPRVQRALGRDPRRAPAARPRGGVGPRRRRPRRGDRASPTPASPR